ncbi:MAG: hypothetical protein HOO67_05445 [Candidatus Peribacteraceae bacterium]|nr:hypothetical protein [Candidatus Peribacteraceae bacterium]
MNYTNTFEDKPQRYSNDSAPTYRFKVMVAREFFEKGGFKTEEEAAWECDKVRLWAIDRGLCGRKVAFNFPDRIASISTNEYENTPVDVNQFLLRVQERCPVKYDFDNKIPPVAGSQSPEVLAAQVESLKSHLAVVDALLPGIMSGKYSPAERDSLVKKSNALRSELVEAIARRS